MTIFYSLTISYPAIISIYISYTCIGLIELLDEAKSFIPKEYWKTTPITLKATAGLRLLPKEEGDAILDVARTVSNLYCRIINRLKRIGNTLKNSLYHESIIFEITGTRKIRISSRRKLNRNHEPNGRRLIWMVHRKLSTRSIQ